MAKLTEEALADLAKAKSALLREFLAAQPPEKNGEDILKLWHQIYDDDVKNTVLRTISGPSHDDTNPVYPYEKLQAIVRDGGDWKWPRMWQRFDEIERRGEAYREGERLHFGQDNKNPGIVAQNVLIVGGGPIGIRMGIELAMGGHYVTIFEKRREIVNEDGSIKSLGFTNRINRPHMWNFVRNDLAKLNGKDLMSRQAAYPVFTEPATSSIGIDELQCLLLKNALLLGVDFRLGVGYNNAKVIYEDDTLRPTWEVECAYDEPAAAYYNKTPGTTKEEFDCLIGCDGPRSTVRDTQERYFGGIEKRKFMDCVGIVCNIQKLTRKRLKELGFEYGQEPGDMNRTKQVFKEFFQKIQAEADADVEHLIYYKASHHNYIILVPKRKDMIKHGLSGKVYTFHQGRDGKGAQDAEKKKLRDYSRRIIQAAGIPLDDDASNGGFVGVPNDCMAFDFAECWNSKKSLFFNLPPPNYSVEEDGEWEGRRLIPLVALAGDSLLEPFWPMGLGLKRGYQAIMDTVFCVDNLYNSGFFCEKKGISEDEWSWDDHFEALLGQCAKNFELCNRMQVSPELATGEYPDKGVVMTQLRKKLKDAEKPPLEVEVDPWTRYESLVFERSSQMKALTPEQQQTWVHPIVLKALKMKEYYDEVSKGGKSGEIEYKGKELISLNGKVTGGFKQHGRRSLTGKTGDSVAAAKKPIGMGALVAGGVPKKPGMDPAAAKVQGGMAALMMGAAPQRALQARQGAEEKAAESPEKARQLAEVRQKIESLTKELEAAKAEERALLAQ